MAGWIKMPFGMEVGLGLGDIVLDVMEFNTSNEINRSYHACLICRGCYMSPQ